MDSPFSLKDEDKDEEKPYYQIKKMLENLDPEDWEKHKDKMLEILRKEYRKTWNIESIRDTLAKVPNFMILDDHEIKDDWGYLPEDKDSNSLNYFYGTLARQVYYEYQRQLREDIPDFDNLSSINSEHYKVILNDVGFVFLDYRGTRTWHKDGHGTDDSPLGERQMEFLKTILTDDEKFAKLDHLFIVSPLTFVFLNQKLLKIGYKFDNDAGENWAFTDTGKNEQIILLNWLKGWKQAKRERIVTILGGDIHMAGHADILYNKEVMFHQFVTSSIASSCPGSVKFTGYKVLKEVESLSDGWTTSHGNWTNKFNYGIVEASYNGSKPVVTCREIVDNNNNNGFEPVVTCREIADNNINIFKRIWAWIKSKITTSE